MNECKHTSIVRRPQAAGVQRPSAVGSRPCRHRPPTRRWSTIRSRRARDAVPRFRLELGLRALPVVVVVVLVVDAPLGRGGRLHQLPGRRPDPRRPRPGVQHRPTGRGCHQPVVAGDPHRRAHRAAVRPDRAPVDRPRARCSPPSGCGGCRPAPTRLWRRRDRRSPAVRRALRRGRDRRAPADVGVGDVGARERAERRVARCGDARARATVARRGDPRAMPSRPRGLVAAGSCSGSGRSCAPTSRS